MSNTIRKTFYTALSIVAVLATAAPVTASANDVSATNVDNLRRSITRQTLSGGRDGVAGADRVDEYSALRTAGTRDKNSPRAAAKSLNDTQPARAADTDFWFYNADVVLFNDDDNDGHYHGIDLLFDADTVYYEAEVYAVVYLSLEGGPWEEYAVTDDFYLYGATSDDEYVVVSELSSGYPTGDYDLLVELYDAFDSEYLTSFGPEDSSELSYLPLEDFNRDAPLIISVVDAGHHGGGGSVSGFLLLGLLSTLGLRAVRQRRPL